MTASGRTAVSPGGSGSARYSSRVRDLVDRALTPSTAGAQILDSAEEAEGKTYGQVEVGRHGRFSPAFTCSSMAVRSRVGRLGLRILRVA